VLSRTCRMIFVFIIALLSASAAYAQPDIHRFDPLLKTSWYGVYMGAAKIGYMKISLEKTDTPTDGWRMVSFMNLVIRAGAESQSMTMEDTREYKSPDGELISSRLLVKSPSGDMEVSGDAVGGNFVIKITIGGQTSERSFVYPLDYLDSVLCLEGRVIAGNLAVGDTFSFSLFEATPPLTGLIHSTVKVTGEEAYLINGIPNDVFVADITIKEANITSRSKIDRSGNMLEGSIGGAMTLKLEDEALATQLDKTFDILGNGIVKVRGEIGDVSKLVKLTLKVGGIDTSMVLATEMQKVISIPDSAFVMELNKQEAPSNALARPEKSPELEAYLVGEAYIQSYAPAIIDLAKQIVGNEKNSWEAAKKINRWVYENIEKSFTPDLSNALQTLNSRRGDCGEHTALTVALLRAAGIPSRPIVGLIYWAPGSGFGYHAWVEAYVGEWVQMDPTWGEDLANPARIAIARGDIISQVRALIKVLGKINIEVVETR